MATILVIDDDPRVCETIRRIVEHMGLTPLTAGSLAAGLTLAQDNDVDVVVLDVRLPDGDGIQALPGFLRAPSEPEVIILTGKGDPDGAQMAIEEGVWDYLVKPTPIKETMLCLERALKYRTEKRACRPARTMNLDGVIGMSPKMRACYDRLAQAADANVSVLITGETGTGKELFARTIHANSSRRDGPFVVIDCASLPENLVESALFGHKKGAFTGADRDALGLVRMADGGTLFLDEVGEMSLAIQKSFLRVLQERRFRPVGDVREMTSDFRLIAATNRDLERMVADGHFRQDLYFRLKAVTIELPPLRERPQDVKLLAMYRVARLCEEYGQPPKSFDPEFFEVLAAYPWPGNVRELYGVLETAFVAAGSGEVLYARHLPHEVRIAVTRAALGRKGLAAAAAGEEAAGDPEPCAVDTRLPLKSFKEEMERCYLQALAAETGGDVERMVARSAVSKSHLYALLKKAGVTLKLP